MDKIDKLLDAIEHPERYSDAEIDEWLHDSEVKEVLELLDKTKSSLGPVTPPDVDAEWAAFESKHRKTSGSGRHRILNLFSRNVAASIAIGIASFAAVAAVVGVSVNHFIRHEDDPSSREYESAANDALRITDTVSIATEEGEAILSVPETVVFDNEPLDSIVSKIASYYGFKAVFKSDASKPLRLHYRWNQALPIEDVVESLNNFEQIHITLEGESIKIY